ncbi:hypothetical protein V1514DRAFT_323593 [Lipomyces japonicus]|uniref:uncharacterized protein n=1 Tax=Lipomyces japonicus TaxID=56871 RepID=UPI0034CF2098
MIIVCLARTRIIQLHVSSILSFTKHLGLRRYHFIMSQNKGLTLADLPKSHVFTAKNPPDPKLPTPEDSKTAEKTLLGPRIVQGGIFSWVRPEEHDLGQAEVLAVSPAALRDLGLLESEKDTDEFKELVIGNRIYDEHYPWAQLYGGWQFGEWAGQLGDGRAISIFESTNPYSDVRYELQLKGAGRTPFSRFADGRAVLRSSIREFLVSEYLNSLSIPTTRALSLTLLHNKKVLRERIEPRAIVARFAQSWIRIGSFDIHQSRGDRKLTRHLADYVLNELFGGLDKLKAEYKEYADLTKYRVLYLEIIRRTAQTVALWQVYGFMNGVLNTDNVSIYGLSLDFGPFSFMDTFDPSFTPNHDDHYLRYSYRNTPTMMWWNLVRLGEDIAELLGVDPEYAESDKWVESGIAKEDFEEFVKKVEKIIVDAGDFYRSTFEKKYAAAFKKRLGLLTNKDDDHKKLIANLLTLLNTHELDFHHFFRRLGKVVLFEGVVMTAEQVADLFVPQDRSKMAPSRDASGKEILNWINNTYKPRLEEENNVDDAGRRERMDKVNPNFVLRNYILDEVINQTESGDRDLLRHVLDLSLSPFKEIWTDDSSSERYKTEQRFVGDISRPSIGIQCSCSS